LRNPASRFSFIRQDASSLLLFANGQCFHCEGSAASFAERLCGESCFPADPEFVASGPTLELIVELYNQGLVAFGREG
jgi:50S ribosomal protein L16 3-hydroxylase